MNGKPGRYLSRFVLYPKRGMETAPTMRFRPITIRRLATTPQRDWGRSPQTPTGGSAQWTENRMH